MCCTATGPCRGSGSQGSGPKQHWTRNILRIAGAGCKLERHCRRIAQRLSQHSKRGLLVSVLELQTLVRAAILREPEQGCVMAWLEGMYPERGTILVR